MTCSLSLFAVCVCFVFGGNNRHGDVLFVLLFFQLICCVVGERVCGI